MIKITETLDELSKEDLFFIPKQIFNMHWHGKFMKNTKTESGEFRYLLVRVKNAGQN